MSANTNESLVRRLFEEGLNGRNLNLIDELIGQDFVNHDLPAPTPGPEGFRQVIGSFLNAFPDMSIAVEQILSEGDRVATHGRWTGTHEGDFNGIPATGINVTVEYADIWRVEDGKLVENWVRMDMIGLMTQLGLIPAPEQTN